MRGKAAGQGPCGGVGGTAFPVGTGAAAVPPSHPCRPPHSRGRRRATATAQTATTTAQTAITPQDAATITPATPPP
ncbi:hypothetical protein, partial [Streptomyces neyagawaensis]|uniref:hypothetical protein n=1 Tax=Streptomyces neyagawaensis TaxID=42238 RepID=UPI001981B383